MCRYGIFILVILQIDEKEGVMEVLTVLEIERLVFQIGPSLGCGDHTYDPIFPEGRNDVAAIRRMAENGRDYGFDTIYLIWKNSDGQIRYREIKNSRTTKDYILINSIVIDKEGFVIVNLGSGGSYSGEVWNESARISIGQ